MGNQNLLTNPFLVERVSFLEKMAFWRGWVGRKDMKVRFGTSPAQSSSDLQALREKAPGVLQYNTRRKTYVGAEPWTPHFFEAIPEKDLPSLFPESVEHFRLPFRHTPVEYLCYVNRALQNQQSIELDYLSASSGTQKWRRITPHTWVWDGRRWHIRAYCHENADFRDFNAGRITGTRQSGPPGALREEDRDWNTQVTVTLALNKDLDSTRRRALDLDYQLINGRLKVTLRKAQVNYFLDQFGFPTDAQTGTLNLREEFILTGVQTAL
ncbi:MAG: WYL domain-containing protein [Opitutales bacterium]|nr:WYL domain-containing protein [Opitutales bacterium]MCH8539788.1 WYL domain-containing protein [Opitutales bacterium]